MDTDRKKAALELEDRENETPAAEYAAIEQMWLKQAKASIIFMPRSHLNAVSTSRD